MPRPQRSEAKRAVVHGAAGRRRPRHSRQHGSWRAVAQMLKGGVDLVLRVIGRLDCSFVKLANLWITTGNSDFAVCHRHS